MPYRCCVPLCKGNYGYADAPNVTVFSCPQDQDIAVPVVLISYVLFNKLLKSYENKFLSIGNKKKV
jgi:hypothetical protein